jgi:DNA-binding beta-propeller fold protein YncE
MLKNLIFLLTLWLCILLGKAYAQPDSTQEVYEYVMQWGTSGSDTGQFNGPSGMCIDDSGYIYVCDRWNNRIQKFDLNGRFILTWGTYGRGPGQFDEPVNITADHYDRIYVHEARGSRVQKFDSRGNFIMIWPYDAVDLACGPYNQIYGSDVGGGPSESLGVYDTLGNRLRSFGVPETTESWDPSAVGIDDSGHIYVGIAPRSLNYITKFDSTGNVLLRWGRNGTGDGEFSYVAGIASGDSYKVFTSEDPIFRPNYRVQKFNTGGQFITKWGTQGNGNGQFQVPFGAALDSLDMVYVSDPFLNRIQKFRKTVVGVEFSERSQAQERQTVSLRCFPNPMKTTTVLKFKLFSPGEALLKIFNTNGQLVRSLAANTRGLNAQELLWDGKDEKGEMVPSGVYFARLENHEVRRMAKITVIR